MLKIVPYKQYQYKVGNGLNTLRELHVNSSMNVTYHVQKDSGQVIGIFFSEELAKEFCKIQLLKMHHERQQFGFIYSYRKPDGSIEWEWKETEV